MRGSLWLVVAAGALGLAWASSGCSGAGRPAGSVFGVVTRYDECGTVVAGQGCPDSPEPLVSLVVAADASGHQVATTRSAADGGYSLNLPPGHYTVTVTKMQKYDCAIDVDVIQGVKNERDIECDVPNP